MSSFERLVEQFIAHPDKITISDVRRLLEDLGYAERKKPGSECVFHKKNSNPICVPTVKGKHVKKVYAKRIARILELEGYLERSEGD